MVKRKHPKKFSKPHKIGIEYVDRNSEVQKTEIKTNQRVTPRPVVTSDYYPTQILGICCKCKMLGNVEFPARFSYKVGDKAMDRKPFECFCIRCNEDTEFIPIPDKNANIEALKWAQRTEKELLEKELSK